MLILDEDELRLGLEGLNQSLARSKLAPSSRFDKPNFQTSSIKAQARILQIYKLGLEAGSGDILTGWGPSGLDA